MNKPTSGPWQAFGSTIGRFPHGRPMQLVADCASRKDASEESQGNAALIVAAVNSCFAINPDNPLAVAEALPELAHAAVMVQKFTTIGETKDFNYPRWAWVALCEAIVKAGAKP